MKEVEKNGGRSIKVIRWTARIWGALIILYVSIIIIGIIYSLITTGEADPHAEEDIPLIEYSGPVLFSISTIGLAVAWKFEGVGGAIVVLAQVLFMILHMVQEPISAEASFIFPMLLSIFVMIPGILFLISWNGSRKIDKK
jgi:hypothetical protein